MRDDTKVDSLKLGIFWDEHFLVGIAHVNDGGFWGAISFTIKGGVFTHFLALIFQGQKLLVLKFKPAICL